MPGLSVWTWLVFGVLVFLLGRFAWKPILGAVEAREKGIQGALDEAAARNAEAAELLEEHRQQLADARRQANEILAEGKAAGERVRKEIEEKARGEGQAIIERARQEIERERDAALESLRKEAVELAMAAASRLLQREPHPGQGPPARGAVPRRDGRGTGGAGVRDETVARSYAATLFELAGRHEGLEAYGAGIETVARLLDEDPKFRLFLETPRIADADKKAVVRKAFDGQVPQELVSFLLITIDKRRQRLLRDIAREFHAMVDEHEGRAHVEVTVARDRWTRRHRRCSRPGCRSSSARRPSRTSASSPRSSVG